MIYPDHLQTVFAEYSRLTAIPIRRPSDHMCRQAMAFTELCQPWELAVAVAYIKAQIRETEGRGGRGYNAQSLTWRKMFGDDTEITEFQARLGLALQWAARHAPQLIPKAEVPKTEPETLPRASQSVWEAGKDAMAATLAKLKGAKA